MLADGIYSVHFETPAGKGSGIVVLTGERLRGGDAAFAYFGTLTQTGSGFRAKIATKRHSEGRASVFNLEAGPHRAAGQIRRLERSLHRYRRRSTRANFQSSFEIHCGLASPARDFSCDAALIAAVLQHQDGAARLGHPRLHDVDLVAT
jgi:hypothetical protein